MRIHLHRNIFLLLLGCFACSFMFINKLDIYEFEEAFWSLDTSIVANTQIGSGSKIMTDQDALVIITPPGAKLASIELYYLNVITTNSDSSRLWIKSQRSWSCAPLGNAHPFQHDQFTLAITDNIAVDTGWNRYSFPEPITLNSDTIYIWPDLIQQIQPRIPYALGNNNSIANLTNFSCATPGQDISILDYVCSLTFLTPPPCISILEITDSDSICYAADTLIARTLIDSGKQINYLSRSYVLLDSTFEIEPTASLIVDMSGCEN